MAQTVQLLASNQFQVITATPEQLARLKPRLQLVQAEDGQYIVCIPVDFVQLISGLLLVLESPGIIFPDSQGLEIP